MWNIVITIAILLSVFGASAIQDDLDLAAVGPHGVQTATRHARHISGNMRVNFRRVRRANGLDGSVFAGYRMDRLNGTSSYHARVYMDGGIEDMPSSAFVGPETHNPFDEDSYTAHGSRFSPIVKPDGWDDRTSLPKHSWTARQKREDGRRRNLCIHMEMTRTDAPSAVSLEDLYAQTVSATSSASLPSVEDFQGPLPEVGQMARHYMGLDLVAWDREAVIIDDGDGELELVPWAEIEAHLERVVKPRPRANERVVRAVVDFKLENAAMLRYFEFDASAWRITEENVGLLSTLARLFAEYEEWQTRHAASFSTRISITRQTWWETSKRARLIQFIASQLDG